MTQTHLSNLLYASGIKARYDTEVKKILSDKTILSWIIAPEKLWGNFSGKARYDLLSVIMICLGNSNSKKNKLIEMLNTVLSNKLNAEEKEELLTNEFGIEMRTDGGINTMCNLSDYIEQIGIRKGIEQGIEQGIEKGIEKGIERERENTVSKLLRNFSIETISQMIDIDIDYVRQIAEKSNNTQLI